MERDSNKAQDSPGVHVPPPTIYAAGFLAGLYASRNWPLGDWPHWLPRAAGGVLCIAALGCAFWAIGLFWLNRTAVFPHKPSSAMVLRGPYRFTRNPMYVSLTLLYVGLSIFARTGWALALLPVVLVVVDRAIIQREEAYLERRFGAEYLEYKRRVRRWA